MEKKEGRGESKRRRLNRGWIVASKARPATYNTVQVPPLGRNCNSRPRCLVSGLRAASGLPLPLGPEAAGGRRAAIARASSSRSRSLNPDT
ncbi:hypothetical protein GBA52_010971 [Prunus armeniaca]|nr:hypothetical protein GBA52_010971 [Prunus armeniaca]